MRGTVWLTGAMVSRNAKIEPSLLLPKVEPITWRIHSGLGAHPSGE